MTIEVKSNIDTKKMLASILEQKKQALEVALVDAVAEIQIRTKSARDASGGRFKGLSPQYLKYKVKKTGRGAPDLSLSGDMLESIDSKVEESGTGLIGKIFFNSAKEAEKARGNSKLRKFFELSKGQVTTILDKLSRA